jgi:chaperonin GroEL (HSP60 family)
MATDVIVNMVVDACTMVTEKVDGKYEVDPDDILIVKKEGTSLNESMLVEGIVLDKEVVHPGMPKTVKNAKIALIDAALEIEKTETDAKIQITSPDQLQKFLDEEERMIKEMAEQIKASGATVVLCQKGIDDLAQHYLAKAHIMAARRIKKSDMEKLAKATGAKIVSNLKDLNSSELGNAGLVEEKKIGDDDMIYVTQCKNSKAVTILLRGGTEHVVAEVERATHDAIRVTECAIEDGAIVAGGGAPEIEVALRLREYAPKVGGREQLAVEAFAKALEIVPKSLAENAGLDPIDTLVSLRSAHEKNNGNYGLNLETGKPEDMMKLNVLEPLRVKSQAINSAGEAAVLLLRIDDVVATKKSGGAPGGAPGAGAGMEDYE